MRPLLLLALVACNGPTEVDVGQDPCFADDVPAEAERRFGWQDDGTFISIGGRLVMPAGPSLDLEHMPIDLVLSPDGATAYVVTVDRRTTALQVVDLDTLAVTQVLDRDNLHNGIVLDAAGTRLYVAGGADEGVEVFDIQSDGSLVEAGVIAVPGATVAGLALSPDEQTLWTASFTDREAYALDTQTLTLSQTYSISTKGWDVAFVPQRNELYISDLNGSNVAVLDLASGTEVATLDLSMSPAGMAVSADGSTVFVAVSNGDRVAAIDTATASIRAEAQVTELDLLDEDGLPLPNSNVNSLWLEGDRLYASRGSDNAVSVLDANTLDWLGAIPTAEYPTGLQVSSTGELVVAAYTGSGEQTGAVTRIDLDGLDLALAAEDVSDLYRSPIDRFGFECDGFFPIPTSPGQDSPIEHVILVVKENKTLDCLFGDLEIDGLDVDPDSQRWDASLTPNQRALMQQFNASDNFYVDARESDSGHVFLTSAHLTHWVEWQWPETTRNSASLAWPLQDAAMPTVGNFFTHLYDHDKSFDIYGEIVGVSAAASDGTRMAEFTDPDYPGGPAVNYSATDEEKALYILEQIEDDGLADFTFVSFPNDHGAGTSPGIPSPESMVADNDRAVGVLVEGISHSGYWPSTVIIVLQDDPQGCGDHVNDSRSPLFVISPWAKRGYVSHTNTNFLSVFATMERILDVPPMGRPDAVAVPLWDFFQPTANVGGFTAIEREPEVINQSSDLGADLTFDFDGPDRDPRWGAFLDVYGKYTMGRITRAEADTLLTQPRMALDEEEWEELEEEAEEETFAFDKDWDWYQQWAADKGIELPQR
ncbi:MAG: SMP-30/gluconolactonase/LRE family protein [Proteobacteria bacterium]|nr:SMP-30/gluconolactonase/LRE family protein [Pseudomonadota bacterium]